MSLKPAGITIAGVVCIAISGCDSGMSIRQRPDTKGPEPAATMADGIEVSVETTHPLIAEDWYAPDVTVTNRGAVTLTITAAELVGSSGTTSCEPGDLSHLPQDIPPHQACTISPYFKLKNPVHKEFAGPVELWVHYTDRKKESQQVVVLEGAALESAASPN